MSHDGFRYAHQRTSALSPNNPSQALAFHYLITVVRVENSQPGFSFSGYHEATPNSWTASVGLLVSVFVITFIFSQCVNHLIKT